LLHRVEKSVVLAYEGEKHC